MGDCFVSVLVQQAEYLPVIGGEGAAPPPQKGEVVADFPVLQGDFHQIAPVKLGLDHRLVKEGDAGPGADQGLDEIEAAINAIMDTLNPPMTTIPGLKNRMGAMILAEIGDFSRFDNPDQILAYAGLSPSTYQSGQLISSYARMEKRGSRYLRYALFNATIYVCIWDPTFKAYLAKKRAEGKHYYVAISHACKKLIRVIYRMQLTGEPYRAS